MKPYSEPCYAIVCHDNNIIIAFGISVIAAWTAAEGITGETTKQLRKHGYKLIEGRWRKLK